MLSGAVFVNDLCKYGPKHVDYVLQDVKSTGNLYSLQL